MDYKRTSLTDADVLGEKGSVSHEDAMHFGELTQEELAIEKKLVRKVDSLIMPFVVTVYLMNYIDRYVRPLCHSNISTCHHPPNEPCSHLA